MHIIVKLIIFYLIFRLIMYLLRKGIYYYQAYRSAMLRKHRQEAVQHKQSLNLKAFDVEDADYEEIKQDRG